MKKINWSRTVEPFGFTYSNNTNKIILILTDYDVEILNVDDGKIVNPTTFYFNTFKTKKEAKSFAINYMRKHPRGI